MLPYWNYYKLLGIFPKTTFIKGTIAFFHQTFQVYHVSCNFILGYICRITVNFGILKDGILLYNIFAAKFVLATETGRRRFVQKKMTPKFDQRLNPGG